MSGNSKNGWNEENSQPGALGHLLERMSSQFTPNHGSLHYQSGFVPAATPPWPSHHQTSFSQHNPHPHIMSLDPSLNTATLGTQVGLNPLRSYSVSQDLIPDMEGRTPLLRSSSDLGMRLNHFPSHRNNFPDCQLDGIMDHQVESLDGAVFFPENSPLPLSNASPYQHLPTSKSNEIIGNQHMHYTYMTEPERPQVQEEQTNNFSTKSGLSNFTASLGTWLSPLDQLRTNYSSNAGEVEDASGNSNRIHENVTDNIQSSAAETTLSQPLTTTTNSHRETKLQIVTKPSYSDVLSKAPTQEGKSFSSTTNSNKVVTFQTSSAAPKSRGEPSLRPSSNKSNKSRNNAGCGRSNSPNTNNSINNTDLNFSSKHSSCYKVDSSYSKVGLDDFDLPESVSNYNSNYSNYLNNLNNNSKTCILENIERTKKRSSLTSEESSPGHQFKKGNRNDAKRLSDKFEESPNSSDVERIHCDKLNNTLSTQQKQTPKRTTYINNNLASLSVGINASKTNNADSSSNNSLHRKAASTKDEAKFQFDNISNVHVNSSKTPPSNNTASGNLNSPLSSSSSSANTGGSSSSRSGVSGPRSNRSTNNNKSERTRDAPSKKNVSKKKKETSPYSHSDLLMTAWTMSLLWMGMVVRAGLWLLRLIVDVVQMSYRLFIHFSLKFWENGKLHFHDVKVALNGYWLRILNYISQKKADSKKGRSDRKSPSGLESNIPLPTTGEEAMKRLLACRGKDPYSILGVTRDCTDDDIKKYYKRQAFLVHPDKNKQPGAEEAFKILAHAFEIIGEPERREQYDKKVAEEVHLEGATGELASLLNLLKEKLEEAANTIRCTNCNKRHRRVKLPRPIYAARHCSDCQIRHAAREGDIWAESWYMGVRWKYFACMEGAIYDISEWAACQRDNLKHLQANTHSVQYRIVSGKKNSGGKNSAPECPTDPELEEFFNNLCRERFGQDFVPGTNQSGSQQSSSSDARKRRGKKKK